MQFFSRVFGAASKTSRVRRADRSPRSRRSQIGVESLEGRDLMSGGATNAGGALVIQAPQAANNTVTVSNDQNGNVIVNLNGNSQMFAAGTVYTISYSGAPQGGDTFINNTGLNGVAVMNGSGNHVVGGSGLNVVALWGDYNSFNAQGGVSYVYCYNGPNDNINTSNGYVNASSYSFSGW